MDASLRRLLAESLGPDAVLHEGAVLVPPSRTAVAAALRLAEEHGIPLRITSGPGIRSQAPEAGAVLSLARLAGLDVDRPRGVARAEAGVTLAALGQALSGAGAAVWGGLESQPGAGRVGALVARGELPRRSLTGIEAALPGGELVMVGATVLKDVVGYDLTSVLLGSRGKLAAIVAVHLRLAPETAGLPAAPISGERVADELAEAFDPHGILAGESIREREPRSAASGRH